MKKTLCRVLLVLVIVAMSVLYVFCCDKRDFAIVSCIDNWPALEMTQVITLNSELKTEEMAMHLVYQLARRNIVKVAVKDSAGSGIIWKIDDDIVIVSSKHILMKGVTAKITFCDGETANANIIGYSQQYDIGFALVSGSLVTSKILRDIYEVVPMITPALTDGKYDNTRAILVGVDYDNNIVDYNVGTVKKIEYLSLLNTHVIVADCYAKAGMSGGGLFDDNGRLLGMVAGGDVAADSSKKESDTSYSLPASLIYEAYEQIMAR